MPSVSTIKRMHALTQHLDMDDDDEIEPVSYDDKLFEVWKQEYLVLTDEEATERAVDYIKDSVWAFTPSFLAGYTRLPEEVFKAMQGQCEDSNDAVLRCIENAGSIEEFAEEAISTDGRGHFLNTYDGKEHGVGEYYIYRIN